MISDPDLFRAAKLLIDQHGIDAPIRAAQRADDVPRIDARDACWVAARMVVEVEFTE